MLILSMRYNLVPMFCFAWVKRSATHFGRKFSALFGPFMQGGIIYHPEKILIAPIWDNPSILQNKKKHKKENSKNSVSKKQFGPKKFGSKKILGPKKFWVQTKFWVQKKFELKKMLVWIKVWVWKKCWVWKKIWVRKICLLLFFFFLCHGPLTP